MSASEKLREQDAQKHWTIPQWRERYGDDWPAESGRLLAALPQIVALTERVEVYIRVDKDRQRRVDTSDMLAALSALEEALS